MTLGIAILILGLLYLLIVSEGFRRVAAALAAIAAVALLLFVLWINQDESQNARKAEAAKTYIKTDQIELVDPRATFGFAGRITGRVRNNSGHALASFELRGRHSRLLASTPMRDGG